MADTHNINSALLTALNKMGVGEIKTVKLRTSEDIVQFNLRMALDVLLRFLY